MSQPTQSPTEVPEAQDTNAPRFKLWSSVAFRMAFNYSALLVVSMLILLVIFYVQTVNVLQGRIDTQIRTNTARLTQEFVDYGEAYLVQQIRDMFRDGVYSDTEIYLLTDSDGHKLIGNIPAVPPRLATHTGILELRVIRNGREAYARLQIVDLPDGGTLVVGSDINHQREIERLFNRATMIAGLMGVLTSIIGALIFRRELRHRINDILQLVAHVKAGDLSRRIPISSEEDEFARLNRDLNTMLDQQQRLMEGVRHVSNTIAHNLRTPLTRILLRLRKSEHLDPESQAADLRFAREELEELATMFDKLLKIAEVESGTRRSQFGAVSLNEVADDVMEFYDPVAEENAITLTVHSEGTPIIRGDRDLLASAIANLVDNAIKYAGENATVTIRTRIVEGKVILEVADNGPGISEADLARIGTHFFRVDRDRPGYGLGMASVMAITQLHEGQLSFKHANPGLIVHIAFPPHVTES